MARFRYRALNAEQQPTWGEIDADSVALAVAELEAKGLAVQSIGFASSESGFIGRTGAGVNAGALADEGESPFAADIEQAALARHLSAVVERGRTILPALRAYAQELPAGRRRRQLGAVIQILERSDVAEATAALKALPTFWIPLLSAAAAARDPGQILQEFLKESQRAEELRRQWWLTLTYPLVVACAAAAVLVLLSFLIVPTFRNMFLDFGLRLPAITRFVIELSAWITSGRILIAAAIFAIAIWILWQATGLLPSPLRHWFSDRFGTLFGRSTAIARFSQFSADLLEAELDTTSALRIAGYAVRSPRLRRAAWRLAREIDAGGEPKVSTYQRTLTATVLYALKPELPAASRIRLLREVSGSYSQRAGGRLSWTRGVIEPIAMCAIGLIVGVYVVGLFMPLFMLIQGLS